MFSIVGVMDVVVVVSDGVADLGLAAILEAFNTANGIRAGLEHPPEAWGVRIVSTGHSVRSGHGHLVPTTPLSDVGGVDMAIVPAAAIVDADALIEAVTAPANRAVCDWLATERDSGADLAAACTGTFFLAEAGVLDGVAATTSWWLGPTMRRRYPLIEVDESRTLCRADGITTAGASLMHFDMALSLIAARSPAVAETVSRYLIVGDRSTQLASAIPEVMARGDSLVAGLERWVRAHLADSLGISDAATELGVTVRTLQRAVQAELGMTPRDFIDEIRLERATHLLQTTTLTVDAVASRVGYLNAGTLRALYRRRRGRSIADVRGAASAWRIPS